MLKIDKQIVKEFLKVDNVKTEIISRLKCSRLYSNGGKVEDNILILTPMLKEDGEFIKNIEMAQKMAGHPVVVTEHKRGRNYVYTFKEKNNTYGQN